MMATQHVPACDAGGDFAPTNAHRSMEDIAIWAHEEFPCAS